MPNKLTNTAKRSTAKTGGTKGKGFPSKLSNTADRAMPAGGHSVPAGPGGKKGAIFGKTTKNTNAKFGKGGGY